MEVTLNPPLWLHFLLWMPLTLVLCLTALRLIKGVLITLQYRQQGGRGPAGPAANERSIRQDGGRSRPRLGIAGSVLGLVLLRHPAGARHLAGPAPALEGRPARAPSTSASHSAPLPLAEVEALYASTGDVDYIAGRRSPARFLHAGERHFFATWEGKSGFNVYTPLRARRRPLRPRQPRLRAL